MSHTNVLLVSADAADHADVRAAIQGVRGQPYRLETARTLADALAAIKAGGVDAMLLDLNLPDSTGVTTFLRVQPKATNIPIVTLVAEQDEDLGKQTVDRGALDYLVRGHVTAQLVDKVLRYATERTHTLKALKASEQRYRELFQNVTAGVFQTTGDGKFMAANPALVRMLGYDSEDELLAVDVARDVYSDPGQRDDWVRCMAEHGEVRNAELVLKRKDGTRLVVLENSRAVCDADGRVLFYEGTLTDITAAHALSQQLTHEASHDPLTGLKNRREFESRLQHALEMVHATGTPHAVCFMDLDRFKVVNDTCGHVAGDELLRQLGQLLQAKVRQADVVARLGGDEFAILLQNCGPNDALQVANNVLRTVSAFQFVWGQHTFSIGVSIGVVVITSNFRRMAQVMSAADTACYAAKDGGRNRVALYTDDAENALRQRTDTDWVGRARRALVENRLFLEAQPIRPLAQGSHEPPHYELLVRMRDDSGRAVPPGAFLPTVERYNLSTRYDRWVIGAALKWMHDHAAALDRVSRLFINLSKDSVVESGTAAYIRHAIAEMGIDPRRVGFEVSEKIAIGNLTQSNQLFSELRRHGQDKVDYAMVRSITEIGHVMGKKVIAESVESDEVIAKLAEIGVDYAQGFRVGEPRPIDEIDSIGMADLLAS